MKKTITILIMNFIFSAVFTEEFKPVGEYTKTKIKSISQATNFKQLSFGVNYLRNDYWIGYNAFDQLFTTNDKGKNWDTLFYGSKKNWQNYLTYVFDKDLIIKRHIKESHLLITKDFGKTWDSIYYNSNYRMESIQYKYGRLLSLIQENKILYSDDKGKSWNQINIPYFLTNSNCTLAQQPLCFLNDKNSFLVNIDIFKDNKHSVSAVTHNMGKTWEYYEHNNIRFNTFPYTKFIYSNNNIFATPNIYINKEDNNDKYQTVLRSNNDAKSWDTIFFHKDLPIRNVAVDDIFYTTNNEVLYMNMCNQLLFTLDNGVSWNIVDFNDALENDTSFVYGSSRIKMYNDFTGYIALFVTTKKMDDKPGYNESYSNIYHFTLDKETITSVKNSNQSINNTVVYPNPANNFLNVSDKFIKDVKIYNLMGIVLIKKEIINNGSISLNGLYPGVYFIEYTDLLGTIKKSKFIVE